MELSITSIDDHATASPTGATTAERSLSVLHATHSPAVVQACLPLKGAIGKAARERAGQDGLIGIVQHCAAGNYKPLADYLAIRTGEHITVAGRAGFELLPTLFADRVENAKAGKAGGMRSAADGTLKPNTKHALALELLAFVENVVAGAALIHEQRREEKRLREIAALLDAAEATEEGVAQ